MAPKLTPADIARKKMNAPFRVDLRSGVYDADTFVKTGKWVNVRSSNVTSIRYDKAAQRFWVRFLRGKNREYHYDSVTIPLAKQFYRAASYGKFVWKIRRMGFVGIPT